MWARINLACPLCLATYGVNAAIFAVALRIRRRLGRENGHWRSLLPRVDVLLRPGDHDYYRETLKLVLGGFAMAGVLLVLAIDAVASKAVLEGQQERLAGLIREIHEGRPVEIPDEDRPARGTPDARTTLVVFSDFMCGQCRLASRYLEIVAANHRGSLRIVYRHFPGDNQCNAHASRSPRPGACTIARAAECAGRRGRFWEFHDAVFRDPGRVMPAKLERYAARAGLWDEAFRSCLGDTAVDASVRSDIALAHSLGVIGTPTTFVNGRGVGGALKPWMLEAAIREIESLSGPASR